MSHPIILLLPILWLTLGFTVSAQAPTPGVVAGETPGIVAGETPGQVLAQSSVSPSATQAKKHPQVSPSTSQAKKYPQVSPSTSQANSGFIDPAPFPQATVPTLAPGIQACNGSPGLSITWSGEVVKWSYLAQDYTPNGPGQWPGASGMTEGCSDLPTIPPFHMFQGQVGVGGDPSDMVSIVETNPSGSYDVSYVQGFSKPVVCWIGPVGSTPEQSPNATNTKVSGCNIDLFSKGPDCPGGVTTVGDTKICKNPTGPGGFHDNGPYNGKPDESPWCYACSPPDPFFAPCAGSAYTYPYDDDAMSAAFTGSLNCCVGTNCPATGREGMGADGHPQPTRSGQPCVPCATGAPKKRDTSKFALAFDA